MILRSLIESRISNFTLDGTLHIRNFLRTLIYQEHDDLAVGIVGRDRIGDLLHKDSLTCLRRRYDHTSLSLTDWAEQIDNPARQILGTGLECKSLIRIDRCQMLELRSLTDDVII